jgi:hypothetical protein
MATSYDPPAWAGKPSVGLHLDVLKVQYGISLHETRKYLEALGLDLQHSM